MVIGTVMSNFVVKFFRKDSQGSSVLIRTEEVDNEFEADFILEQEEGHYDYVAIEELRKN